MDPRSEFKYDGLSVHPYEVMFVPMSTIAIENGWSFAKLAAQYETWMSLQVTSCPGSTARACYYEEFQLRNV